MTVEDCTVEFFTTQFCLLLWVNIWRYYFWHCILEDYSFLDFFFFNLLNCLVEIFFIRFTHLWSPDVYEKWKGVSTIGRHTARCNEGKIRAFESWQRWVWVPALPSLTAGCWSNGLNYLNLNCHICKMGAIRLISQSHDGVVSKRPAHRGCRVNGSDW